MVEINLLENQIVDKTEAPKNQTKTIFWLVVIMLILFVLSVVGAFFLTQRMTAQVAEISRDTQNYKQEIVNQNDQLKDAKIYQAKLSNLNLLLKNHTYMSYLFDELENYTFVRGKYDIFQVGEDSGKIQLQGITDSYENLGKLILGLSTSSKFDEVTLVSVSKDKGKDNIYNFSVTMHAKPNTFNLR
jgi:Tfp pilus assembly protein PilN